MEGGNIVRDEKPTKVDCPDSRARANVEDACCLVGIGRKVQLALEGELQDMILRIYSR